MTLALIAGTRLGPYEILAPLGAGGMGEVYRARDTRLGREVAIKVLPTSFSGDPDRLRRFQQEAKAAGLLNHPNITAVYDVGEANGSPYVVQELLEGETLHALLADAPFSVRRAVDYATQVARGLAAAHEKGIVHRDLKPENVFVTRDGRVKILDFGLAKLTQPESGAKPSSEMPTAGTEPGVVLGTLGYMSPEQVRGKPADPRSDIFAFGAILYEMLSGKRAFQGSSAADTASAILSEEPPDLAAINPKVSTTLERIVRHCLEKNAEQRFRSAHDLAFDLEDSSDASGDRAITAMGRSATASVRSPTIYRRLTFRRGLIVSARFSPDAETIVYSARWEGAPRETFAMRLDNPESRALGLPDWLLCGISSAGEMALVQHAERGRGPTKGVLARMPLVGGAPREVLEDVQWADWSPDGRDLAVVRSVDGRTRIEFPIGTAVYESIFRIGFARVSPGGDLLAFLDYSRLDEISGSVMVVDRRGRVKRLSEFWGETRGLAWSPDNEEIWFSASNVGAKLSLRAVSLEGRERLVAQVPGGVHLHDISRTGRVLLSHEITRMGILCRVAGESIERELSWFDFSTGPDLAGDGSAVVFSEEGEGGGPFLSTYLRRTDGSPAIRLGEGTALALSPDSKWVISLPTSSGSLVLIPTGVGQTRELVHAGLVHHAVAAWFSDCRRILFTANEQGRPPRSYVEDLDLTGPRPTTPEGVIAYVVSPDGQYVVSGDPVPKLYPLEGGAPLSIAGACAGDIPIRWHEDGRFLFVRSGFLPANVSRIDMVTGLRESFLQLMPSDPAGVTFLGRITLTPEARSYAYSYTWRRSDLYIAEGLR